MKNSMKPKILASTFVLTGICLSVFAGPEDAPVPTTSSKDPKDMKDMKEIKQMAATPESDAGFYIAAYGGSQFSTDYGNNRQTSSSLFANGGTNTTIHSGWGAVGGLKGGYNFNSFPISNFMSLRLQPAVEAEGLYIGDHSSASNLAGPGSSEHFSTNSGDFFVNGILRFKNSSIVTPYIGAGVGLQYFTSNGSINEPSAGISARNLDTSDVDFAAQALFGLDVAVAKHVSVFTEYKFIDAIGVDGSASNVPGGGSYHFKPDQLQQNLITAGVKYSF
jgi:opacity protein-like surface antigen